MPETRFRQWRRENGLTQQEIADLCGRDISTISRIERGELQVAPLTRVLIARRLGVRVADLFPVEDVEIAS